MHYNISALYFNEEISKIDVVIHISCLNLVHTKILQFVELTIKVDNHVKINFKTIKNKKTKTRKKQEKLNFF